MSDEDKAKLGDVCVNLKSANSLLFLVQAGAAEQLSDNTVSYALYALWQHYDSILDQLANIGY